MPSPRPFHSAMRRMCAPIGCSLLFGLVSACMPGPPTQPDDPFSGSGRFTGEPRPASLEQIRGMEAQLAAPVAQHPAGRDLVGLRGRISKARSLPEQQALMHDYLHDVAALEPEEKSAALRQLGDVLAQSRASLIREIKRTH